MIGSRDLWRRLGLGFVCAWFLIGGVGHFVVTPASTSIVPPFVPNPRFWVLFKDV